MSQGPGGLPAPTGVVYTTSMTRPDAALALAALYVTASRRQARVNGVCVTGAGLNAAIFCDLVARFYAGQTARIPSSNTVLPIGFPADPPGLPNPPMVEAAVNRKRGDGSPQYTRLIQRPSDTAAPDAMLRNAITLSVEAVVVLSAPATWLARSLELSGTADQYKRRVKRVVVVEAGGVAEDAAAWKRLIELAPVPVITCPRDVGDTLALSRAQVESGLAWAPAHPIADAVRAAAGDTVPLHDLAALHYALHPDSGFFSVSDGRLAVEPARRTECAAVLLALATARPAPPPPRGGGLFP